MKYAKAIIVNPPNPKGYMSNKDSMGGFGQLYTKGAPPFPPLDLAYLAGVLVQAGFASKVIEAGALDLSPEEARLRIASETDHTSTTCASSTSD